ncbi:MAG: delta-9 acyl-phospholipid desaturase [Candidatus Zambryskibacteria bacterium RIFCSPLOWO2_12_FULL_45_14]|uniref:Delta-9 acyl-phospholipid desaturase n=1 Tax=Candidatus Zambryskibacteria bacterium RIFCSPLOWO2_12_FULL_45_14 TaxID=1802778 RepID=A0A1G2UWL0_9BACT|nr:MAG: delta-9 acyl-phospholipid desaturase [Candidatus Zambryskibacteria bacterium RIFCSPLOWO2_12_FULL_45_14]
MEHPINRAAALWIAVLHVGALAALFFISWSHIILAVAVYTVAGSLGIGVGYHRLLTHRGFKTYPWVEYTLTVCASLALQGAALSWVAAHRIHHRYSDEPKLDPHTPKDGRWWSHMDWILHPDPETFDKAYREKWVRDLLRRAFFRYQNRFWWLPMVTLGIICLFVGGIPTVLWGVAVPVVATWHSTWLVNSATHMWGSRRFETKDESRNNWWVALLTFGEGWHNNHHWSPTRARHGFKWYEIDVNWYVIKFLQSVGLAWEVKS